MLRTAASLAGMTLVFGLVLYLAYGSGSGGDSAATPTPAPSDLVAASPTSTARPTVTSSPAPSAAPSYLAGDLIGTSVVPVRQGPPIDFPDDIALIIETGCWQCDGPTTGLDRIYRDPSGKIRTETLVSAETLGLMNPDSGYPAVIGSFDALDDASWMVVAFCTAGECNLLGGPDANARTTFFESTDGGVTWEQIADLAGSYQIVALVPGTYTRDRDVIVSGPASTDPEAPFDQHLRYMLSGEEIVPPAEAGEFPWPYVAPSGEILWQTDGSRLLTSSGTPFFFAGLRAYIAGDIGSDLHGTRWGIRWVFSVGNGPSPYLLTLTDETGKVIRSLEYDRYISYGANSTADVMYGNAEMEPGLFGADLPNPNFSLLPVEIHLNDGIFYPILDPFTDEPFNYGRNRVVAVQTGPFARVVNTDDSCLNVRDEASLDGGIIDCLAEGVLLRLGGTSVVAEDTVWALVYTPDGREGWAAAEYLDYLPVGIP